MRTPIDLYENEWLPSPKAEQDMLRFIEKVQRDAFNSGVAYGVTYGVNTLAKTKPKDQHDPHQPL